MGHSFTSRERLAQNRTWSLLLVLMCAGCSDSPSSFVSRLTENGRLLAEGPPARMTTRAIAETRTDAVPLLYSFAVEAGQIRPVVGTPFPETDLNRQQAALSSSSINWPMVTLVGEGYIDEQCNRFLSALNELERSKRTTLANVNAIQSATVGIMGLALAAQKTIGIVGIAFGLAASLIDNTTSVVIYQLPASSIRAIVMAQRDVLRHNETAVDGPVTKITSQGLAYARLSEYMQYCVPVTIEANISSVVGRTKITSDGSQITVSDGQPAVTSSLAPVISGIPAGTPVIPIVPTKPGTSTEVPRNIHNRLLAVVRSIRATTDTQTLRSVAVALNIPLTVADMQTQKAIIIAEINNRVMTGDPATTAVRMTQIEQAVLPVITPAN